MVDAGHPAGWRRRIREMPRWAAGALAAVAFALIAALAFRVTVEVNDRRSEGFCRPDHGIAGAIGSETRTWWPVGERCFLHLADGSTLVRNPGWALTALLLASSAAVAAGMVAPSASARRRVAWAVAIPALPLAALILITVQPRSLARLVALTSISLGFGSIFAAVTAAALWALIRGRAWPTILGSWSAWAVIIFLQGRSSIGP